MFENFMESLKALKNYTGLKLLFALTLIAWFFLFFREKRKNVRIVLVFMPAIVGVLFLCPFVRMIFIKTGLDAATYYRVLWIIPMGIITVCAMVRVLAYLSEKARFIGVVVAAGIIAACGSYVYDSASLYASENVYGLPDATIEVVDYIRSIDDSDCIMVLPSADLIFTLRQYDAKIYMPYGRDMYNVNCDYYSEIFERYEKPELLNVKNLVEATRNEDVEYIVIYAARLLEDDPLDAGLVYMGEVSDHLIYRDPVVSAKMEEIEKYYQ